MMEDKTDYIAAAHTIIFACSGKATADNVKLVSLLLNAMSITAQKAGSKLAFQMIREEINKPSEDELRIRESIKMVNDMLK